MDIDTLEQHINRVAGRAEEGIPAPTELGKYTTPILKTLLEYLNSPTANLVEEILGKASDAYRVMSWDQDVFDKRSMLIRQSMKGAAQGIDWCLDLKKRVEAELEDRATVAKD